MAHPIRSFIWYKCNCQENYKEIWETLKFGIKTFHRYLGSFTFGANAVTSFLCHFELEI